VLASGGKWPQFFEEPGIDDLVVLQRPPGQGGKLEPVPSRRATRST
jgi:hypothetical protein